MQRLSSVADARGDGALPMGESRDGVGVRAAQEGGIRGRHRTGALAIGTRESRAHSLL